jgi:hypothetical protein
MRVRWVAHHDTGECHFSELATQLVKNLCEDNAPKDAKYNGVMCGRGQERERHTTLRSFRTTKCEVAKFDHRDDRA